MNKKIACLILFALFLTQISAVAYADDFWSDTISPGIEFVLNLFGIPPEWQTMPEFFYYFIIPFIGIWAILLGFLRVIPIFQRSPRLELIITFVIAFSTVWPTGWLMIIVKILFTTIGFFAVGAFGGLFLFGILIFAVVSGRGMWGMGWGKGGTIHAVRSYDQKIADLQRKIDDIDKNTNLTADEKNTKTTPLKAELKKLKDAKAEILR